MAGIIQELADRIKTNIAQKTNIFDKEPAKSVIAKIKGSVIHIEGFKGEYTLSNAQEGDTSAGSINDTYVFKDGKCHTGTHLSKNEEVYRIVAHKVDVGIAYEKTTAIKIVTVPKSNNKIIVYMKGATNTRLSDSSGIITREPCRFYYTMGVFFKVKAIEPIIQDYFEWDKFCINSIVGLKLPHLGKIEVRGVDGRFREGDSYIVDFEIGCFSDTFNKTGFLESIKHFKGEINPPILKIKGD